MSAPDAPAIYGAGLSQRWSGGASRFVPPERLFDPSIHGIEEVGRAACAALLAEHHYLATCPVPVRAYGLFRKDGPAASRLVGCAVFGMPASQATVTARTGLPAEAGLELTRFLALDVVEFNGETHFLARALAALRAERPALRAVIAHSDPVPRIDRDGRTAFRGHVGQIYCASNAIYAGRAKPRIALVAANGEVVPDRLLSKARRDGLGADGAERRIVALGAPPRAPHQERRAWLDAVLASGCFARARHPGVHAFVLPLDRDARRGIGAAHPPRPRPRERDAAIAA